MLLFNKMAKEMNVTCNFLMNQLVCELPEHTMDVMLKVRTKTGEHTFREDVCTQTLKYRRWNNGLRLFRSLKRRVANIFHKRNSFTDDIRRTSTQTSVNQIHSEEEKSIVSDDRRHSVHSDWSNLMSVNAEAEYKKIHRDGKELNVDRGTASVTDDLLRPSAPPMKKTIKNIVLVPYTPKPKDWGNWHIRSPYAISTVTSPYAVTKQVNQEGEEKERELVYEPHSPYYSPVHPPEFYEDE